MNDHDPNDTGRDCPSSPERLRKNFEQHAQHLDATTANRLRLMRRDALLPAHRVSRNHWRPVGVVSLTVLAVGLAWWTPRSSPPPAEPVSVSVDVSDAAMLEEDSDLYAWLGDAPIATASREEHSP